MKWLFEICWVYITTVSGWMCFEALWSSAAWEIVHSKLKNCWHNESVTLCFALINVTFCEEILSPLLFLLWVGSSYSSLKPHQLSCLVVWCLFKPVLMNVCCGRGGFHQGRALHGRGGAPRLQGFHQHLRVQQLAAPQGELCLSSHSAVTLPARTAHYSIRNRERSKCLVLEMWYKLFTHGINPWCSWSSLATGWSWAIKPHEELVCMLSHL